MSSNMAGKSVDRSSSIDCLKNIDHITYIDLSCIFRLSSFLHFKLLVGGLEPLYLSICWE